MRTIAVVVWRESDEESDVVVVFVLSAGVGMKYV